MPESEPIALKCLNCGAERIDGKYCNRCGQPVVREKLNLRFILEDAWATFTDFDNRWWKTFLSLFTRPGKMTAEYAEGMRRSYAGPIQYAFVVLALTIGFAPSGPAGLFDLARFFPSYTPSEHIDLSTSEGIALAFINLFSEIPQLYLLAMSPIVAAVLMLFFGSKKRNYTESLVFSLFLTTQLFVIYVAYSLLAQSLGVFVRESPVSQFLYLLLTASIFLIYIGKAIEDFYVTSLFRAVGGSFCLALIYVAGLLVILDTLNFMLFGTYVCAQGGTEPMELYRCIVLDSGLRFNPITDNFAVRPFYYIIDYKFLMTE